MGLIIYGWCKHEAYITVVACKQIFLLFISELPLYELNFPGKKKVPLDCVKCLSDHVIGMLLCVVA